MTRADPNKVPWLAIYAQREEHENARIVGSRAGLERLRDAIDSALSCGASAWERVVAPDGEHYDVVIGPRTPQEIWRAEPHYHRHRQ